MAGGPLLPVVSSLMGWTYVICWSISLYPPIMLNARLRSVEGVSLDFIYLNLLGYLAYTTSLSMLYFSDRVRNEYAQRHTLQESGALNFPLVRFNDVAYGAHGTLLVLFTIYQIYFKGYSRGASQRVSRHLKIILWLGALASVATVLYALRVQGAPQHLEWYDLAVILGDVKIIMSAAKYVPQALYNRKRRSTKGWSMAAVRLDIIGGLLSLCQLFLDGYIREDMKGIWNNSVKLALAAITIVFDLLFCFQHYVLYPPKQDEKLELGPM